MFHSCKDFNVIKIFLNFKLWTLRLRSVSKKRLLSEVVIERSRDMVIERSRDMVIERSRSIEIWLLSEVVTERSRSIEVWLLSGDEITTKDFF